MLKRFREKLRTWEDALIGIDDPQGDYQTALEKRLTLLETEVALLKAQPRGRAVQEECPKNKG